MDTVMFSLKYGYYSIKAQINNQAAYMKKKRVNMYLQLPIDKPEWK